MTTLFVQFTDASEATILSVFSCQQDPTAYPNQASIQTSDARYASYYASIPVVMQRGFPAPG